MDFTKVELLNPNTLTFTRKSNLDATSDPAFDADNDLLFSKNGVVISFPKPLEGYRWLELELENTGAPIINLIIDCYANSAGGTTEKATAIVAALNSYARYRVKIPNIGRCERIEMLAATHFAGNFVAIKSLKVVLDTPDFSKLVSSVVPTMTGWTYDAVNQWYYKDFAAADSGVWSVAAAFESYNDYVTVKIWNLTDEAISWNFANIEGKTINMIGHSFEFDYSGNPLVQDFPINLNIFGPNSGGRVYASFRYSKFPAQVTNAFVNNALGSTTQLPAVPSNILTANNVWSGSNEFQGAFTLTGRNGWLKAVAGLVTALATIPVGDIYNGATPLLNADNVWGGVGVGAGSNQFTAPTYFVDNLVWFPPSYAGKYLKGNIGLFAGALTAQTGVPVSDLTGSGSITITGGSIDNLAYLGVKASNPLASGILVAVGQTNNHPSTLAGIDGINVNLVAPATATSRLTGYSSNLGTAANLAINNIYHFRAVTTTVGVGSTVLNSMGFFASNTIATATNNYGFYSALNAATNTWGFYGAGTASSYFGGPVSILTNDPQASLLLLGNGTVHPNTGAFLNVIAYNVIGPSTAVTALVGVNSLLQTSAAAYTLGSLVHFYANTTTKGAGSAITGAYGFYAENTVAVGINNYAFYGNFAFAANTFNFYAGGTADNQFNGKVNANSTTNSLITSGAVGILDSTPFANDSLLSIGIANNHLSNAASVFGIRLNYRSGVSTNTTSRGFDAILGTQAVAVTLADLNFYTARQVVKGAGSTITNVCGFYASSGIAGAATNTYGYYSDINSATSTFQLYMGGTAWNFLNGQTGINASANFNIALGVGVTSNLDTNPTKYGVVSSGAFNSSTTTIGTGFSAQVTTAAVAFTLTDLVGFAAEAINKGAGSTITNVKGFWAKNSIAVGTNNYGFYSDINNATNTYQLYMAGTAINRCNGAFGVLNDPGSAIILAGSGNTHPNTGVSIYSFYTAITAPSTATNKFTGYHSDLSSAAAAFTLSSLTHFHAFSATKGAGSTINSVSGFIASNAIAVGTTNYGFYSDINSATNTWALRMAGTADSQFDGPLVIKRAIFTEVTITYSASMTPDASAGDSQIITATNATAFTINAPSNPRTGQRLRITLRNTSGGVLGAATWNAVYKMTAWTNPANGFSRTIEFEYNGTNWIEHDRTAADVPN